MIGIKLWIPVGGAHDGLSDLQVLLVDLLLELVEHGPGPCLELGQLLPLLHTPPYRHAPATQIVQYSAAGPRFYKFCVHCTVYSK